MLSMGPGLNAAVLAASACGLNHDVLRIRGLPHDPHSRWRRRYDKYGHQRDFQVRNMSPPLGLTTQIHLD